MNADPASPSLGTILRKLVAALDGGVQAVYDDIGAPFRPRYFPIVRHLLATGEDSVSALAVAQGVSQPAVSQTLREMGQDGLVSVVPGADRRARVVRLTPEAHALADRLAPIWSAVDAAARALEEESGGALGALAARMLAALEDRPFDARVREAIR